MEEMHRARQGKRAWNYHALRLPPSPNIPVFTNLKLSELVLFFFCMLVCFFVLEAFYRVFYGETSFHRHN